MSSLLHAGRRRFYKGAVVDQRSNGFGVALDGRPLPTPAKRPLVLPTQNLAAAIAAEWAGQGESIDPGTMPLMRLAATAIDRVPDHRTAIVDEIAAYADADLLCHRAERPAELVRRQQELWQPPLDWLIHRYDVALAVTTGIGRADHAPTALARLRDIVDSRDAFQLVALHAATTASGSVVLGLMMAAGDANADQVFQASMIDELYQAERWGIDAEAAARRTAIAADLAATAQFLALLDP